MSNANKETKTFEPGQRILTKGDPATCAYMLNTGRVRAFLEKNGKLITLAELKPGAIFGEASLIDGGTYGAHIEAIDRTELTLITPENFSEKLDSADPMLRSIIEMLIARLRKTNEALLESETREYMDIILV